MSLNDMVMIKDNHLLVSNSIENITKNARKQHRNVEVEVENQRDAMIAASSGATIVMLDNFSPAQIKKTISSLQKKKIRNKVKLEASGGINSKNIAAYAKTGVDMISVGSITNSVKSLDLSLEVCV
jgi:nicotinate-nucleotide pyrophosphorylase (carboxylating)